MDAVGALRLREKGTGIVVRVIYCRSSCTVRALPWVVVEIQFKRRTRDCFGTYSSNKPESIMAFDSDSGFRVN
jgi:hypothetical protein